MIQIFVIVRIYNGCWVMHGCYQAYSTLEERGYCCQYMFHGWYEICYLNSPSCGLVTITKLLSMGFSRPLFHAECDSLNFEMTLECGCKLLIYIECRYCNARIRLMSYIFHTMFGRGIGYVPFLLWSLWWGNSLWQSIAYGRY